MGIRRGASYPGLSERGEENPGSNVPRWNFFMNALRWRVNSMEFGMDSIMERRALVQGYDAEHRIQDYLKGGKKMLVPMFYVGTFL